MLDASARQIVERVGRDGLLLDVGGWAKPFPRADWVVDLMPYETRGLYEYTDADRAQERFTAETWVQRDVCDRAPWPFADAQFDFAICAQTLEDVRDPLWVCQELVRVARAGYVEVPSRLEEQSVGVGGQLSWAGWSHHRWLCDVEDGGLTFVHKPPFLHLSAECSFTPAFYSRLTPEEKVSQLWWEASLPAREIVFVADEPLRDYLSEPVRRLEPLEARSGPVRRFVERLRRRP
jgi:hypothetical protein